MKIQVLVEMGQDRPPKEEVGCILEQRVKIVTYTQELFHSTCNFLQVMGYYLVLDGLLRRDVYTRPCQIDRYKHKYDKMFVANILFGNGIM